MPFFIQPFWLIIGLIICCGTILFFKLRSSRRHKELEKFAASHLLPILTANISPARRRLKRTLFVLGLACLFIAMARPEWGNHWVELKHRGIDILLAFDVSRSMLSPDIKPNRLQRAKLAVRDFAAKLDGDRIGLIPFAGTSFLMCPLTTDYDAFTSSLDALDTETIPKGGTNIGGVIRDALQILAKETNYKILVLITDGEDLSQDALAAAQLAKKEKMVIYTVGVGTKQGELIPLGDNSGKFVKDISGKFVTSRLDEKTLTALAQATGGIYVPLGTMGQGLDTIYQHKLALIPKEEHAQRKRKVPIERFQWPLGAALLFFCADFLVIGRRKKLNLPSIFSVGRRKQRNLTATLFLVALCAAAPARADQGLDLFQAGKYEQAANYYQEQVKQHDSPLLQFNLGTALHKAGKDAEASKAFSKALQTDDIDLQAKSYYNQGLSQYHAGEAVKQKDLDQAITALKKAEDSFHAATHLFPSPAKQKKARRYQKQVEQERKLLEKQRQQQQKQQNEQDKKQQDKKQDSQKDSSQDDKKENKQSEEDKKKNSAQQQSEQNKKNEQKEQEKSEEKNKQKQGNEKKQQGQQKKDKQAEPQAQDKSEQKAQEKKSSEQAQKKDEKTAQPEKQQPDTQKHKQEGVMTGKMSEEEAKNLLDSLKDEQGKLNFIPQEAADGDEVGRDW